MFIEGQVYRRSEIHDQFRGSRQSGISASAKSPYIFIFSGSGGLKHGYEDGWENPNVFSYSGEGQEGDMEFVRGNLALRDHQQNGKRVFLFEFVRKGFWRYSAELEYMNFSFGDVVDSNGELRRGIRFFLKRKGSKLPYDETLFKNKAADSGQKHFDVPNETERRGLVTSRVGQGAYRQRILHRWEFKCAVTGFDDPAILIASHILPWKDATNKQRVDPDNGILLSPLYDALFDRHLISFHEDGSILLSRKISNDAFKRIGVSGEERIKDLTRENHPYLQLHRKNLIFD